MRFPTVSVCIPAYCGAAHIAATLESVLAQTFGDFELIVIDDHSPDETLSVVESFRDPRMRVARNGRNLGAQANWNLCLQMARGRYFKLLPQDDLIAPECLARQVAALESDRSEGLALVFCARWIIDARGSCIMRRGLPNRMRGEVEAGRLLRRCIRLGSNLIGEPGAVLLRTALARRIGDFDAALPYVTDLDYWFRLLSHGNAYYLPEELVSFRVSRGSWSVALAKRQSAEFRKFIAKIATSPPCNPSAADRTIGMVMASVNAGLRTALYRAVLG